jgi:hypothetical protein
MIYTLTACFGIFLGICGQIQRYDYPSFNQCEKARISLPVASIGNGYAICYPKQQQKS